MTFSESVYDKWRLRGIAMGNCKRFLCTSRIIAVLVLIIGISFPTNSYAQDPSDDYEIFTINDLTDQAYEGIWYDTAYGFSLLYPGEWAVVYDEKDGYFEAADSEVYSGLIVRDTDGGTYHGADIDIWYEYDLQNIDFINAQRANCNGIRIIYGYSFNGEGGASAIDIQIPQIMENGNIVRILMWLDKKYSLQDLESYKNTLLSSLHWTERTGEIQGADANPDRNIDMNSVEGDGFDTPEEAVEAFLDGFVSNDIRMMLSACAIESFVDCYRYDLAVKRFGGITPYIGDGFIPVRSNYSYDLDMEIRRTALTRQFHYSYLTMIGSVLMDEQHIYYDPEQEVDALISEIYTDDTAIVSDIHFDSFYMDPDTVTDGRISNDYFAGNVEKAQNIYGVEELVCLLPIVDIAGEEYYYPFDVGLYGDRWRIITPGGQLGSILGISAYNGGLIKISEISN